jgi:apolipoprotein D and lipocalin family protein
MRHFLIFAPLLAGLASDASAERRTDSTSGKHKQQMPIATVEFMDLQQFSGSWYVIACIPTWFERDIYNAVESYQVTGDGKVRTVFSFNKGGFDGPRKSLTPTGFVQPDGSNAFWKMQFVWPFKAEYRVVYLDDDYQTTIIGRSKRDYLWIMARTPILDRETLAKLMEHAVQLGYDRERIQLVPQRWPLPFAETADHPARGTL